MAIMSSREALYDFILQDASRVVDRLNAWKGDYLDSFAQSRRTDHIHMIFNTRFHDIPVRLLLNLPAPLMTQVKTIYNHFEDIYWNLLHTQDMPTTLEDYLDRQVHLLEESLQLMRELGGQMLGERTFNIV
jgi:hypothetical protein